MVTVGMVVTAGAAMADNSVKEALVSDHVELYDPVQARRYFAKCGRIGTVETGNCLFRPAASLLFLRLRI